MSMDSSIFKNTLKLALCLRNDKISNIVLSYNKLAKIVVVRIKNLRIANHVNFKFQSILNKIKHILMFYVTALKTLWFSLY